MVLTDPMSDVLRFNVKDEDMTVDDAVGTLDVPLAQYYNKPESELWAELTCAKGVEKAGSLHYKVQIVLAQPVEYAAKETGATLTSRPSTWRPPEKAKKD
jgi:hypothetical protein